MTYEHIIVERRDAVGLITLNRPEALNALCTPLIFEAGRRWTPSRCRWPALVAAHVALGLVVCVVMLAWFSFLIYALGGAAQEGWTAGDAWWSEQETWARRRSRACWPRQLRCT